jgi:hypothetical protein
VLAGFLGGVAAFLTIPLGMPAFIFGMHARVDWIAVVMRAGFYLPVALMALSAGVRAQLRFEATTRVGERGTSLHVGPVVGDVVRDWQIAKAAYAAQVTLIGVYGVGLRAERPRPFRTFHFSNALRRAPGLLRCAARYRGKEFSLIFGGKAGSSRRGRRKKNGRTADYADSTDIRKRLHLRHPSNPRFKK